MTSQNSILYKLLTVLVLGVGVALILYQFPYLPQKVSFDEIEFAKVALSLNHQSYIPYSTLATGHATLYFYLINLSLKIFGVTPLGLRLPSAISGIWSLYLFYLILKEVFQPKEGNIKRIIHSIPIIGVGVFATSRWFFNFARFSFEGTFLLALELAALYFSIVFVKKNRNSALMLSGIFTGLAYNSYTPGRIFWIVPLWLIVHELWTRTRFEKKSFHLLSIFVLPCIALALPLGIYFSIHKDIRINQLSYVTNDQLNIAKIAQFAWDNIQRAVFMFINRGDMNGRHNYPGKAATNPIMTLFFIAGIVKLIFSKKDRYDIMFLLYFIVSFLPALLTYPWENPNMLRTYTLIPSIVYFMMKTVEYILSSVRTKKYLLIAVCSILYLSGIYEVRTYFIYQREVFWDAFEYQDQLLEPMSRDVYPVGK